MWGGVTVRMKRYDVIVSHEKNHVKKSRQPQLENFRQILATQTYTSQAEIVDALKLKVMPV